MSRQDKLRVLHEEIDRQAAGLERRHAQRLVCRRGCHACCVDDITVFDIEAERIRRDFAKVLAEQRPHPVGACAFLDSEGACRVYAGRPYVCRTQGLPLRWLDDTDATRPVERRDICPLNDCESEPIEHLPAGDCWEIGPFESRMATLETERSGHPPRRVRLRDLWG